ncbi:MAG: NADH-quinone oxidoreductase subunit M [Betaproteobacteria bacterium TMED156]|nr:MAG: NADH-quinone oxidoreductase subunit M [Betaproteobacteria bacterium TMED156]
MSLNLINSTIPWLSIAIWMPILSGIFVVYIGGKTFNFSSQNVKFLSLLFSVISLILTIVPIFIFDPKIDAFQLVEKIKWIERFNIEYFLGIDGISLWFLPLASFMTLLVIVASWDNIKKNISLYMGSFLILSGLMIGVFSALDGLLFYLFFEATLIPMYFIIGIWGGPRRVYAAFKFFLYTFLGSILALLAIIYLYIDSGSFSIIDWHVLPLSLTVQIYIFSAFFLAFAVKIPMWPVHTWLPDAHVEAPTGGSIVLAAIMLKLGGYGFLRFSLPISPDASQYLSPIILTLSLIAIVYIGLVALVQKDMKKLVAYSSVAHMGFVTLGFFFFSNLGFYGGIVQMISHGFISGAMFFCIGVLYDRMHSREISDYSGVANKMPIFASFFVFFAMANAGLPGTSGFVGEFFVILAALEKNFWIGLLAALTLILGASYSLWLVKRVIFGEVKNEKVEKLMDLSPREFFLMLLLSLFVLIIGIKPGILTDKMSVSIDRLIDQLEYGKSVSKHSILSSSIEVSSKNTFLSGTSK